MLMSLRYQLIENQSIFTDELRNAMVLKDDFLIYSEVIRRIVHLFFTNSKKMQLIQFSLFVK